MKSGGVLMNSILPFFRRKKIGLALGGGAILGMCHIGVLQALDELKIPISSISGTSAGSLVGVLYASDISPSQLKRIALSTHWGLLAKPSLPRRGIFSTEPMEEFLKKYLDTLHIEDLKIPFSAIAVDVVEGKEIIFHEGYIPTAIRSSCAVPGIFRPIEQGEMLLIDGGIMDNVPVAPVQHLGAELIIAVSITPGFNTWKPKNTPELILKSFLLAQLSNTKREMSHADIIIDIDTKKISPVDFRSSEELIEMGYHIAMGILKDNPLIP